MKISIVPTATIVDAFKKLLPRLLQLLFGLPKTQKTKGFVTVFWGVSQQHIYSPQVQFKVGTPQITTILNSPPIKNGSRPFPKLSKKIQKKWNSLETKNVTLEFFNSNTHHCLMRPCGSAHFKASSTFFRVFTFKCLGFRFLMAQNMF